jgi:hypothetical protein
MRRSTAETLCASVFAACLAFGCGKKPAGPAAAATPAPPKDGVSSVPTPAERSADMASVDNPIAGAVKEIKAKVLDKEADDKTKGLVRIKAFDGPVEVSENTRWEIWKPGADPEEQKPELTVWANNEAAVPAGIWDVRLHYEESPVCKAVGWVRGVKVEPGKLWKAEAALTAPMEYVRIFATLDGADLGDNAHIDVYKAGTDQEEFKPIASFWSTQKIAVGAGSYDLRLNYDKGGVKGKAAVKTFAVGSDHGILKKTIPLAKP